MRRLSVGHYKWVRRHKPALFDRVQIFLCIDCSISFADAAMIDQDKEKDRLGRSWVPWQGRGGDDLQLADEDAADFLATRFPKRCGRRADEDEGEEGDQPPADADVSTTNEMRRALSLPLIPRRDRTALARARPWRHADGRGEEPAHAPVKALVLPDVNLGRRGGAPKRRPKPSAGGGGGGGGGDGGGGGLFALTTLGEEAAQWEAAPKKPVVPKGEAAQRKVRALQAEAAAAEAARRRARAKATERPPPKRATSIADVAAAAAAREGGGRPTGTRSEPRLGPAAGATRSQRAALLAAQHEALDATHEAELALEERIRSLQAQMEQYEEQREGLAKARRAKADEAAPSPPARDPAAADGGGEDGAARSAHGGGEDVAALREVLARELRRVVDFFAEADVHDSGVIGKREFRKALPLLTFAKPTATKRDMDLLFAELDTHGDGAISYKHLGDVLHGGRHAPPPLSEESGTSGRT